MKKTPLKLEKIGKTNINVLFVGLLLPGGVFIPIIWENPRQALTPTKQNASA
ncbi:MAG: hypothetical protein R2825_28145 [Saprospiraceae bacterium]